MRLNVIRFAILAFGAALLLPAMLQGVSAQETGQVDLPKGVEAAMNTISSARIRVHLRYLSSDLLEGRGTGERGGRLAAEYIATYLQLSALWPGLPGNSYKQKVPLVGVETLPASSLVFEGPDGTVGPSLVMQDDYVLWTETQRPMVDSGGDLIFVGYGVEAPEYDWDDYKGQDVAGKVLLMLVNDPPSEDPAHFGGKALTYYGRWTYKYEIATAKGAAGAILIHTDESAGYGWTVVRNGWSIELSSNEIDPRAPAPLAQAGWLTEEAGRAVLQAAGQDFDALREAAARRDFTPVPLGLQAKAHIETAIRKFDTKNVIAYVPGTDENLKDEAVVITAHYDHLGIGAADDNGDKIYNGAYDNASGIAAMLDMARAMRLGTVKPRRSVVFIAAAAEEKGLRGSEYYTTNPTFPVGKIAANINLDGVSVLGVTKDMTFLGGDRSTLNEYVMDAAIRFDIDIKPDSHPEQGFFYRSDHFNFAKVGVPALSIRHGQTYEGRDAEWGEQQWQDYRKNRYHQPGDEYRPGWDLKGAEQTAKIAFYLAYRVADADTMPAWNVGDEFAAARAEALRAAGDPSD